MKVSRKKRHGRKRKPQPHGDHHNVGATNDPVTRAKRVDYRRARLDQSGEDLDSGEAG